MQFVFFTLSRLRHLPTAVRAWLVRYCTNEQQLLFALTLLTGVVCGLAAVAFHLTIRAAESLLIERAVHAPGSSWMLWTVVSPAAGGLLAGAALTWLVPGARGSGIPQVKVAYATEGGRVRFRDALGKFAIAAVQIGSGASLGREGPTVQICAGATSALARAASLPPRTMRRLTPVGVAAGIAAAFNAPIAAVTFTIEEIVGTLDNTVLSGVVVAAALSAVIERGILGVHPVIEVAQSYGLDHASSLIVYAFLGIAAAVVSIAFTDGLLELRRRFRELRAIPHWAHPSVGGLVTGILAVVVLYGFGTTGITGGGYAALGRALAGQFGFRTLVALCIAKLIATVFSYSSGGAGGIFAPALFIGAMLGGVFGYVDALLLSHGPQTLGAFALVGMGAVFAGIIRAPITSVLIIFEMTGGYGLVLPLMLANMTSYVLARHWRPLPIYEALLDQDGIVLPHAVPRRTSVEPMTLATIMTSSDVRSVAGDVSIAEAAASLGRHTIAPVPVLDEHRHVLGVVSLADLRHPSAVLDAPVTTVLQQAHTIPIEATPMVALVRMNDLGTRQLLVIDDHAKLVGVVTISDIARAYTRVTPVAPAPRTISQPFGRVLKAARLGIRVTVVPGATKLSDVMSLMSDVGCLIVRTGEELGVLLVDDLRKVARDEDLQDMLIAADLVRPAPCVDETADLDEIVRVMGADPAAIVMGLPDGEPLGVVTRATVAATVLDWFVASGASSSDTVYRSAKHKPA